MDEMPNWSYTPHTDVYNIEVLSNIWKYTWINGMCVWYLNDILMNGGPHEYFEESFWFKNGMWHREDGPAIINNDNGQVLWYLNGIDYDFHKWLELIPVSIEEKIILKLRHHG